MLKLKREFLWIIAGCGLLFSCKHDAADLIGFPKVCPNEIKAIYATCTQCHGGDGELNFSTWQGILNGITPYKPLSSRYYTVLTSEWIGIMPPDKPLSQDQRTKIRIWIVQGADSTDCPPADTAQISSASVVKPGVITHPEELSFNSPEQPDWTFSSKNWDLPDETKVQQ